MNSPASPPMRAEQRRQSGIAARLVEGASLAPALMPALIVAVIAYEVVARYVFSRPTLWAYELSWWLAGMTYLLAGLQVMRQRRHIRIAIVYDLLPLSGRRFCDVVGWLCLLGFCVAVVWGGLDDAWKKLATWERLGSAWNPPIPAIMKPLILVTVILITAQGLVNLVADWRAPPPPERLPD